jgi:hypothetical protein
MGRPIDKGAIAAVSHRRKAVRGNREWGRGEEGERGKGKGRSWMNILDKYLG